VRPVERLGPRWRAAFLVLGVSGLLVVASLRLHPQPDGLEWVVEQAPLNSSDPGQSHAGPLRFRGGLWLRSADPRFGGLSDLRVDEDGSHLVAVSDCGYGFSATLVYDARGATSSTFARRDSWSSGARTAALSWVGSETPRA